MNEYFYILVAVVVLTLLWRSYKQYTADKEAAQEHEQNTHPASPAAAEAPKAEVPIAEAPKAEAFAPSEANEDEGADYLLLATEKGREAKSAMREKHNAEAWELLQQQKTLYSQLKTHQSMSDAEFTALDSSVSKDLANLLRLDKNHKDALIHTIYWVANSKAVTKDQDSKLGAYFNRAKLNGTDLAGVMDFCLAKGVKEFNAIQDKVNSWS